MNFIDKRIEEVLISAEEIQFGITKAANWINLNYQNRTPILIGILKGCIPFFGQIISQINVDCETDFMSITSFKGGIKAQSEPTIDLDLKTDIKDREIIILEDIIDTARSLSKIKDRLLQKGAKNVCIVTLLDKKANRMVDLSADYACFEIPDKFIVGFGLDYKEQLRNLPYIGTLKKEYIK